jgi:protein O-GlcNAc transferase
VGAAEDALQNAIKAMNSGRPTEAEALFKKALVLKPDLADAWLGRGNALVKLERYDQAFAAYDRALALKPDLAGAWLGHLLANLGRYDDSLAAYDKALAVKPDLAEAWLGRCHSFVKLQRYSEAIMAYDRAIAIEPRQASAWLGHLLASLERYEEALTAYDKTLAIRPDLAQATLGRGNVFFKRERHDEALAAYDKALALRPDLAEAWLGRGNVFTELERYDEALAACDKALALKPDLAEARLGRGNVFSKLKHLDEALTAYGKALVLKPDLAEAWLGRANLFSDLGRYDEALATYDKALALKPDLAEASLGRGNALTAAGRHAEALTAYDRGLALKPNLVGLEGLRLRSKQNICDWQSFESDSNHLIESVGKNKFSTDPFIFLSIASSAREQYNCARQWISKRHPPIKTPAWNGEIYKHDRIRIGYVSADFQEHPVTYLLAGVFESHDKSMFDTTAISIGPSDNSAMRRRLEGAFESFLDAERLSDTDIVEKIRAAEIDVLVDLNGFTKNCRTNIFAHRPAPIQVNYLGYPGTIGAEFIDYIIADRTIIPISQQNDFAEKVAYFPDSCQASDSTRTISERTFTREECGLPNDGFVFCCFNNNYKITPDVFDLWMRIMVKVPGSVLWLRGDNATAEINLKRESELRGVSAERIIFAQRLPLLPDHLARHRLADLFLDTLPYNAHTTASDALWAGLPVLTRMGETFAGRVAASLLNAVALPELVTHGSNEYEHLAVEIAKNPETLRAMKEKLAENRLSKPLFDTKLFTRQLEAAYAAMHERYQAGLAPDTIVVPN